MNRGLKSSAAADYLPVYLQHINDSPRINTTNSEKKNVLGVIFDPDPGH